jgi:hypothetical protein
MIALAIAALIVQSGSGPLFDKLFPNPTGLNGYEEYVRASDMLNAGGFRALVDETTPGTPNARQYLAIAKDAVQKFGRAADLVRQGNLKAVSDPRRSITFDTVFPEIGEMRNIARLLLFEAYVSFSAGNSSAGLSSLTDGLTFGRKIQTATMIQFLVGVAVQSLMFWQLDQRLGQLCLADAGKLEKHCEAALKEKTRLAAVLETERVAQSAALDGIIQNPSAFVTEPEEPETAAQIKAIQGLSEAAKRQLAGRVREVLGRRMAVTLATLDGPESGWKAPDLTTGDADTDSILGILSPNYEQLFNAAIRERTQYRLALLHAKIIKFHWLMGKLPESLENLNARDAVEDPNNGGTFVYEKSEDGYVIFSKGTSSTGPIFLRRKAPRPEQEVPPPGYNCP